MEYLLFYYWSTFFLENSISVFILSYVKYNFFVIICEIY